MHQYKLPNDIIIDHEHLIEAVLDENEFGSYFFDCRLGIVLYLPNRASLGLWQAEIKDQTRYTHT